MWETHMLNFYVPRNKSEIKGDVSDEVTRIIRWSRLQIS